MVLCQSNSARYVQIITMSCENRDLSILFVNDLMQQPHGAVLSTERRKQRFNCYTILRHYFLVQRVAEHCKKLLIHTSTIYGLYNREAMIIIYVCFFFPSQLFPTSCGPTFQKVCRTIYRQIEVPVLFDF